MTEPGRPLVGAARFCMGRVRQKHDATVALPPFAHRPSFDLVISFTSTLSMERAR